MKVHFVLNVPAQLALSDPSGEYNPGAEEVSYPTTDGRILILPVRAAERLNALDLQPQESFGLCKRWDGEKGSIPTFDFWLSPASEKARAAEETPEQPAQEPARSNVPPMPNQPNPPKPWKHQKRRKVEQMPTPQAPEQPELWDGRATGTYGPLPTPRPAIAAGIRPPRIPYNVAFREVVQFVTAGLKEAGEQWSDAAKQDMISTVLISASQQGLLQLWERP